MTSAALTRNRPAGRAREDWTVFVHGDLAGPYWITRAVEFFQDKEAGSWIPHIRHRGAWWPVHTSSAGKLFIHLAEPAR